MINLDSDGLLLDWCGYVIPTHFPTMTIKELNALDPLTRTAKLEAMYRADPQLFYKLKPIPGAAEFLEFINNTGERWGILTSAGTDHPDPQMAIDCKVLSLSMAFGIPAERITVTASSSDKQNYCNPGDILIDDFHRNIKEWQAKGGVGILVGERIDWTATMAAVDEALNPAYA